MTSEGSRFFSEDSSFLKTEQEDGATVREDNDRIGTLPSSPQVGVRSTGTKGLFVPEDDDDEEECDDRNAGESAEPEKSVEPGESAYDDGFILFESQVQAIVPEMSPGLLKELYDRYKDHQDPVIKAVNHYFEEDAFKPEPMVYIPPQPQAVERDGTPGSDEDALWGPSGLPRPVLSCLHSSQRSREKASKIESLTQKPIPESIKWRRFIGSLQVTGWATRPTVKPIPYGTRLTVTKRFADLSNFTKRRRTNGASGSYVKLIKDVDDPSKRQEVGRLPEDIASMLYHLVDHDVCDFDVTMVLCDGRLHTGDSFIVQLDCFLTSKIFEKYKAKTSEDDIKLVRHRGFENGAQVTPDEKLKRDRQVAMFKLFNRLNFEVVDPDKAHEPEPEPEEVEVIDLESDDLNLQVARTTHPSTQSETDEMNLNQLKEFYKRTQTEKVLETLPETEVGDNFKLQLRSYQKQGLTWMLRSERELESNDDSSELMNPLWKAFKWPKDRSWVVMRKESLRPRFEGQDSFYGNLYSGEFSLEKPILKNQCKGGILADEMGLGKTISTLALIHHTPRDKTFDLQSPSSSAYAYATTLIIVPTSLLSQWQDEFLKANNDNSSVLVYYGSDTGINLKDTLCVPDPPMVVLTSYGTVQAEWSKMSANGGILHGSVFSVKFFRIVLDEGHNIRNRLNKTTKACYELKSTRKWLLTGTPIINRLDDLYSLIKFLELEPWANISYWNTFITVPFAKKDYKQALDVVQSILEPILLRRTKNMKKNGKPLVELPAKEVVIEKVKFSPKERRLYDWFLMRAESSVKDGIKRGDILRKYTMILVHILRLRQMCCHMDLLTSSSEEMDEDLSSKNLTPLDIPAELLSDSEAFPPNEMNIAIAHIHKTYLNLNELECAICLADPITPFEEICFTECGHSFCLSCLLEHCNYQELRNQTPQCPNCKAEISSSRLLQPQRTIKVNEPGSYSLLPYANLRSSKMNALLSHLRMVRDTCPNEKVVVFSQFSSFLDIMENVFSKEPGFEVYKFDGRLSFEKRKKVLDNFKSANDKVTVLLLSLKAGGVGLNLTEASRAYMCDPWWSPSVEDQAIDRIHRIGQSNNVKVVRFIMEGSIEEKMLKIQERKRTIGEAVEAEEEERRKRRVEEIQMLFEST